MQVKLFDVARVAVEIAIRLDAVNPDRASHDAWTPASQNVEHCGRGLVSRVDGCSKTDGIVRTGGFAGPAGAEEGADATGLDVPRDAVEQAARLELGVDPQ